MLRRTLLLSVRPRYAERILAGIKTVELRRIRPRVSKGDVLLLYVSSPVKALKAISRVNEITWSEPNELWRQIAHRAGITHHEFQDYFGGADMGCAIHLQEVQELSPSISLSALREQWPGFSPPQLYYYLTSKKLSALLEIMSLCERNSDLDIFTYFQPSLPILSPSC
jgi:predicted transcriptional regulator